MWAVLRSLRKIDVNALEPRPAWAVCGSHLDVQNTAGDLGGGGVLPQSRTRKDLNGISAFQGAASVANFHMHIHNAEIVLGRDLDGIADLPMIGRSIKRLDGWGLQKIPNTKRKSGFICQLGSQFIRFGGVRVAQRNPGVYCCFFEALLVGKLCRAQVILTLADGIYGSWHTDLALEH